MNGIWRENSFTLLLSFLRINCLYAKIGQLISVMDSCAEPISMKHGDAV